MDYSDFTDMELLDLAIASSSELASLGGGLMIDYESDTQWVVPDEETALFLASARPIVEELISRIGELRGKLMNWERRNSR